MALRYGAAVIYELVVTLGDVQPAVWRRVRVPAEIKLGDLHRVLQIVMGWRDAHLHQFEVAGELIGVPDPEISQPLTDESKVALVDVALEKTRFRYDYDFRDVWRHEIVVDRVVRDAEGEVRCLDGRRACPPEDCGGWAGYDELLEILANPLHDEHADRLSKLGGTFDPEAFDVEEVNERLRRRPPPDHDRSHAPSVLLH
jgi:hypothetical protein